MALRLVRGRHGFTNDGLREKIGQGRGEPGCAFGIEMEFIGQVILCGERGGIDGNQWVHTGPLGSADELTDSNLGRWGWRDKENKFCALRLTDGTELLEARIRDGLELGAWRNGRLRFEE